MNAKSALRWALLAIVAGSLGIYAMKDPATAGANSDSGSAPADVDAAKVVVTYFTTDVRCDSCRKIERMTREAIEEGFPEEVASGEVVFRMLNTDRSENEHFLDDYEIANKTVIVSHRENGKEVEWANRQDVWLLLDDPEKFFAYVRKPVRRYLGGN